MTLLSLPWTSAFVSHPGAVRAENEDAYLEAHDLGLWAVADGMGGHEGGEIASRMVIDALDSLEPAASRDAVVDNVRARLEAANSSIRQLSLSRYDGRLIGSTVAVLVACDERVVCLWAGDSRIYRWRAGGLERLTRDHNRAEELIELGLLDRAEAGSHALSNMVTRAIGVIDNLAIDRRSEPVEQGDRFVLCSDGLNRVVSDDEIAGALNDPSCDSIAHELLALALQRGATDNVTLGIVQAGDTQEPTIVGKPSASHDPE